MTGTFQDEARMGEALSTADDGQSPLYTEEEFGGGARWGHVQSLPGLALWAVHCDNRDAGPCGLRPDSPETGEGAVRVEGDWGPGAG